MKALYAGMAAVFLSESGVGLAAEAGSVSDPELKVGDSWVLEKTVQKGPSGFSRQREVLSVERVNSDSMVVSIKPDGAPGNPENHLVGLDWGLKLAVDGEQKATARPLSFPMKVGESWTADWTDPRRSGNQVSAHFKRTYKVVGWEDVTVPAGTFHCLKVEENGTADADMVVPSVAQATAVGAPGASTGVTHVQAGGRGVLHVTTFAAFWYAPEVKHLVKSVEEQYNASEVMTERTTEELVSFKPAG